MKKILGKIIIVTLAIASLFNLSVGALATNIADSHSCLSSEASEFLRSHNVDPSIFNTSFVTMDANTQIANSYNESVLSLKSAASTNNFTDEQIQKYVTGLISTPTTVVSSPDNFKSGDFSENRPRDNGIGYEVKSLPGYYQGTAYVTLPEVDRGNSPKSSAYMFYTVSSSSESWGIDVGLWYCSGTGGEAWRGCYTASGNGLISGDVIPGLTSGSRVYFNSCVENNGYLRFRVLDANDFSIVLYDISYYVNDHGIYRNNAIHNRQISLCNNDANFHTKAYMHNARFDDAYLYSNSGYYPVSDANTQASRRGVFGTNNTNRNQVTINSSNHWDSEDISIDF